MKTIDGYKVVVCDIDSTLLHWNLSKYPKHKIITTKMYGHKIKLYPNQKNINLVKKFSKLGYFIILWSKTGADWAEHAATILNLKRYVNICMTKPSYYIDDLDANAWMSRVHREPDEK